MDISSRTHRDIILITESGYLMLVKSFTDQEVQFWWTWNHLCSRWNKNNCWRHEAEKTASWDSLKNVKLRNFPLKTNKPTKFSDGTKNIVFQTTSIQCQNQSFPSRCAGNWEWWQKQRKSAARCSAFTLKPNKRKDDHNDNW